MLRKCRGGCAGRVFRQVGHVITQVFLMPPRRTKPQVEDQQVTYTVNFWEHETRNHRNAGTSANITADALLRLLMPRWT
jgi:hypothetical protein